MKENKSDNVLDTGIQHSATSRKRRISSGRLHECLGYSYSTFYRRQRRLRDAVFSDWDFWKRYCSSSREDVARDNTVTLPSSSTVQGTVGLPSTSETVTVVSQIEENQLQVVPEKMTQKELVRKAIMELFLQNNVTGALAQNILDFMRKFIPHVPTTIRGLLKDSGMCVPRFLGRKGNLQCQLREFDTYENCKKGVELSRSNDQGTKRAGMDENTLPMPSKRPKRDVKKIEKNFLYNSMDIDEVASEAGCI
uniref:Uncharacterized protein n=1 Tax=Trichobilharzia regenti TaxID=157069 RepID=A0AA85KII3_TRIRE